MKINLLGLFCLFVCSLLMSGCGTTKGVGKIKGTDVNGNTVEFAVIDFEGISGHAKTVVKVLRNKDGNIVSVDPLWSGGGSSVLPSIVSGGAQVGTGYQIRRGLEKSGDSYTVNNNNNGGNTTSGAAASATSAAAAGAASFNTNTNTNQNRNTTNANNDNSNNNRNNNLNANLNLD